MFPGLKLSVIGFIVHVSTFAGWAASEGRAPAVGDVLCAMMLTIQFRMARGGVEGMSGAVELLRVSLCIYSPEFAS